MFRVIQPMLSSGQGTKVVDGGSHYQCGPGIASLMNARRATHKAPADEALVMVVSFLFEKYSVLDLMMDRAVGVRPSDGSIHHFEQFAKRIAKRIASEDGRGSDRGDVRLIAVRHLQDVLRDYSAAHLTADEEVEVLARLRRIRDIEEEVYIDKSRDEILELLVTA